MDTETLAETEADVVVVPKRKRSSVTHPRTLPGRKISNVFQALDGFRDVTHQRVCRKTSTSVSYQAADDRHHPTKMSKCHERIENTYKLEPDRTFPDGAVREIIADALHRHLNGTIYDQRESPYKAKLISEDIKAKVKALNVDRYRVVCLVHLGSDTGQEIKIVSRALWSPQIDTFATSCFKSGNLFAVATVYGVYFE